MPRAEQSTTVSAGSASVDLDDMIALRWIVRQAQLNLQRGLTGIPGQFATALRGQGLEFDDLRLYQAGDDIRYLDWNVTARTGKPHVRLYREERERTVTIALDLGPAMFTGSAQLMAVSACHAAGAMLWHSAQTGGRCALVVHDGQSLAFTRPAAGERGVLSACSAIVAAFERAMANRQMHTPLTTTSLDELLRWMTRARRGNGLMVLASALHPDHDQWYQLLREAASSGHVAVLCIGDPLYERGLPPGNYPYRGQHGATRVRINRRQANRLRQHLRNQVAHIEQLCAQCQVPVARYSGESITDLFRSIQTAAY